MVPRHHKYVFLSSGLITHHYHDAANYVLLMLAIYCSLLIMCCSCLYIAHHVLLMFIQCSLLIMCCSRLLHVAHYSAWVAHACYMPLTIHYYVLLMFTVCCSLLMGCSYSVCCLQLGIYCLSSMYHSHAPN